MAELFARARRAAQLRPTRFVTSSSLAKGSPGQIVALFALSLVAMVPLLAMIVDGGNIYVQRRTVQNAADAASLAGTRALMNAVVSPDVTVAAEVCKYLAANEFGTAATATASFVNTSGAVISTYPLSLGTCNVLAPQSNTLPPAASGPDAAAGVKVDAQIIFNTFLAGVVIGGKPGVPNVTARATGYTQAATVSSFVEAPFILCGLGTLVFGGIPHAQSVLKLVGGVYQVDPLAVGQTFIINDTTVTDCGAGATFQGLSDPSNTGITAVPATLPWVIGTQASPTTTIVDGVAGCASWQDNTARPCVMVIPIADSGLPPPTFTMHAVAWAPFLIATTGSGRHSAKLLANYNLVGSPDSTFTWTWGSKLPASVTSMALRS